MLCMMVLLPYGEVGYAKMIKMKCITLNLRYDNKGDGVNKWDVSQGVKVKQCVIPQEEPVNGVYLSDHNPVISQLQM